MINKKSCYDMDIRKRNIFVTKQTNEKGVLTDRPHLFPLFLFANVYCPCPLVV